MGKTVEIDETDLQNRTNIAQFVQKAMNHPEARKLMLQVQKTLDPDSITENDVADAHIKPLMERLDALETGLKEKEEEVAEAAEEKKKKDLETRWNDGKAKAKDAGYTDEGLEALETFMETNGILDHEIAIPAFEKANPPPAPAAESASPLHPIFAPEAKEDTDLKPLWDGNEDSFVRNVVNDTLGRKVY